MKKSKKKLRVLWVLLIFSVGVIVCGYLGTSIYFRSHFYPHTEMGELDVSQMTVTQVKELIDDNIRNYQLKLIERNGAYEILSGSDILLRAEYGNTIDDMMKNQLGFDFPLAFFSKHSIDRQPVAFDEAAFQSAIEKLTCMQENLQTDSQDAYIKYENEEFVIIPEIYGTRLEMGNFNEQLSDCIYGLVSELDLEQNGCYINPMKTKDDLGMVNAVSKANDYLQTKITYKAGKKTMVFGPDEVHEMLTLSEESGKVTLSKTALKNFVAKLDATYTTVGSKKFKTSYDNRDVTIKRGDYGWKVNQDAEYKELKRALKEHVVETREPIYSQKAASHGKYDYGKNYVEVNLTAQHLFVYENGKIVFETDFVSGNESHGTATRMGMSRIKYKQENATLKGADYESHVNFWMPFDGGIGLHDATWRSEFGGSIYKTRGSHGCINLPYSAAKKIYSLVKTGEPVVVYKLPGTEPKVDVEEVKKKDDKKPNKKPNKKPKTENDEESEDD